MADETMSPFSPPKANLEGPVDAAVILSLAPRGARLASGFLDGLVMLPIIAVAGISALGLRAGEDGASHPGPLFFAGMGLAGLLVIVVVVLQLYLLATRGQTLGKRWMKIRIVKLDGSNPGFVGAVLLRAFVNGLITAIPYLGGIYGLVDALFIFRDDRRCIHDLIAGTRVVQL